MISEMKIEGNYRSDFQTIETITAKQLAQIPSRMKTPTKFGYGTVIKKIIEVEPLNNEYVAVKFLTCEE